MISQAEIAIWAAAGESETLELKRSTAQRREAARTLCAMLNHRGGRLLFGVEPNGRVGGQQVSDHTLEEVARELGEIDPPTFPSIDRVAVDGGREVLVVVVPVGHSQPYTYRGTAYRRVGATNQTLSRDEYNRILLERLHAETRWENQPATDWSVTDLDQEEIRRTLEEGIRVGRVEDPGTRDPAAILHGLGLMKRGTLLRGAVVLFGRGELLPAEFPQCLLRVARFKGTDKTEFLDNRQFRGHAFDLLVQAQRFLLDHVPVAGRIVPDRLERVDEPLYPPLAVREAFANAICHRDYSIGGGSIGVALYDDRLEVTSSGALHFGLTPTALFEPHESLPWNPLIASVFYRRGIIETWGRGTLKMAELAEGAGLPRPEIEEIAVAVVVRFRRSRQILPSLAEHDLNDRQQALLVALSAAPSMSMSQLLQRLGNQYPERTVQQDLASLRQVGRVELVGFGRGARWNIKP